MHDMLIVFKKRAIETKTKTETKIQRLNHENTHTHTHTHTHTEGKNNKLIFEYLQVSNV